MVLDLKQIKEGANPDLILMTGDLIDRRHYAKEPAVLLMQGCIDIAPTAYVTGNHEIWHGSSSALMSELDSMGVIVLNNEAISVSDSNGSFVLTGVADRADFMGQYDYESEPVKNDIRLGLIQSHSKCIDHYRVGRSGPKFV